MDMPFIRFGSEITLIRGALDALERRSRQPVSSSGEAIDPVGRAKHILRMRHARNAIFPAELFADPAWDLLLDLYVGRTEGRNTSVSSACTAAAVPATTALRWIGHLERRGMIVRRADPEDRRRIFLDLATAASDKLERLLTKGAGGSLQG